MSTLGSLEFGVWMRSSLNRKRFCANKILSVGRRISARRPVDWNSDSTSSASHSTLDVVVHVPSRCCIPDVGFVVASGTTLEPGANRPRRVGSIWTPPMRKSWDLDQTWELRRSADLPFRCLPLEPRWRQYLGPQYCRPKRSTPGRSPVLRGRETKSQTKRE